MQSAATALTVNSNFHTWINTSEGCVAGYKDHFTYIPGGQLREEEKIGLMIAEFRWLHPFWLVFMRKKKEAKLYEWNFQVLPNSLATVSLQREVTRAIMKSNVCYLHEYI